MYNTHTPPQTIPELLKELGDNENIIVLKNERKIYVPVGALQDTFETTVCNYIMITNENEAGARRINPHEALKMIRENYSLTIN